VKKQDDKWVVVCGSCGLRYEKPVTSQEYIDVYNEFVDAFNAGKIG